jgi:hypothetical protein
MSPQFTSGYYYFISNSSESLYWQLMPQNIRQFTKWVVKRSINSNISIYDVILFNFALKKCFTNDGTADGGWIGWNNVSVGLILSVFLDATSPTQLDDYIALGILGLYLERGCRVEVIRLAGGLSSREQHTSSILSSIQGRRFLENDSHHYLPPSHVSPCSFETTHWVLLTENVEFHFILK